MRLGISMFRKFSCLLCITICLQVNAHGLAQDITLSMKNMPLVKVLNEIEKQAHCSFIYDKNLLGNAGKVSIEADHQPLETVLNTLFHDEPIDFKLSGAYIVLSLKSAPAKKVTDHSFFTAISDTIRGKIMDTADNPLSGASVRLKGRKTTVQTNPDGNYVIATTDDAYAVLEVSYVGYISQQIPIKQQAIVNVRLRAESRSLDDVVVVGYGTQKKRDVTGAVSSLPGSRLEQVPNINLYEAIQGAIAGVQVTTSTAGAAPSQSIMVRGRRSITASNSPLVVVDGVAGDLGDLTPDDVQSVEVLKDASAAAIYGSRGANGVILVTTKAGTEGKSKLSYNGYYSTQRFAKLPDIMHGEDFYQFKKDRIAGTGYDFTPSELANYNAGKFTNWVDLALRNGQTANHDLSLSGGSKATKYYISGSYTDVKGLAVNDNYKKFSTRINLDSKFRNWLTLGTRTQINYVDQGGIAPAWDGDNGVFSLNPLTSAYDANGNLTIYPWPEDNYFHNPLMGTLAKDVDKYYQVISNNFAMVDFPFVPGLQYRINAGFKMTFTDRATYYGQNTEEGLADRGDASTSRNYSNNSVIENILNYNREFGKHRIFVTGVYSFENSKSSTNSLDAQGFPNDFLTWYSSAQAESHVPSYAYSETTLLSNMLRVNYSYNSRYLLTLTGRRDGYSGFGSEKKWGFFPSAAAGWNISRENFFKWRNIFSDLKLRASYGVNGNQAIDAYQTISRLSSQDLVAGAATMPGYVPSALGQDNLGWESTKTLNAGIDFGILHNRITGDINLYRQNTYNLILDRTISPIYAVNSITQNIGKTENTGLELSLVSKNIDTRDFKWETSGNISFIKNKIVSLYGIKDANGKEIDDVANAWFIGKPILVNYGFKWDGVWQLNEADKAAAYGTQPGYIKIKDVSGPNGKPDGKLSPDYDRVIIGQRDPKYTWGMTNTFSYKHFSLRVFVYGVQGVTKNNTLLDDVAVDPSVRMTTIKKNWWTPTNPTNDWYMNKLDAAKEQGQTANPYENASFVRIKDISLAYTFPKNLLSRVGIDRCQIYVTGTNLHTFTKFGGLDPELSGQRAIPLQKEYVFGLNIDF